MASYGEFVAGGKAAYARSVADAALPLSVRVQGLAEAASLFLRAAQTSPSGSDESTSALKNTCIARVRAAALILDERPPPSAREAAARRAEAVRLADGAFEAGMSALAAAVAAGRAAVWCCSVLAWLEACAGAAAAPGAELPCPPLAFTAAERSGLSQRVSSGRAMRAACLATRWTLCTAFARAAFQAAVVAQSSGDQRLCSRLLGEMEPLMAASLETAPISGVPHAVAAAYELADAVAVSRGIAESVSLREQADDLHRMIFAEREDVQMDGVYRLVDMYREAARLTSGRDLEHEARALGSLGRIWDAVLKDATRARAVFRQVVQLTLALHPRDLTGEPFYAHAAERLRVMQLESLVQENRSRSEAEAPFLAKIKDQLDAIDAASRRGAYYLLQHVYAAHEPVVAVHRRTPEQTKAFKVGKKVLRSAVIAYHTDKLEHSKDESEAHMLRYLLFRKIVQALNAHYERFKNE